MWIQHPQLGAFSLVLADKLDEAGADPDTLMIRGRSQQHLALLQAAHPVLAAFPIQESRPELDYRYRLVVPKAAAAQAVSEMVAAVDYRNVKSTAHANESKVGAPFVHALHQIWGALLAVQVDGRKGKRGQ